uniref:HEAT repeat domain-containing protein n=1 Tax=Trichloromonas sp. TaxID=3069249 RepID=UPI003D81C3B1
TREELIDFLVLSLCQKSNVRESRERLLSLVVCFRGKIEKHLLQHLAEETDAQSRKILGAALIRLGPTACPVLIEYLKDSRWFVVRNAIGIVGEIRDQQTTPHLVPMLAHEDIRVRRETIRALTKIGGRSAEGTLLQILDCEDRDMRRQTILSLGALKCTAALPALLDLASQRDGKDRRLDEKKEAINALGQIGSSDAVPQLKAILKRRRFWFGSRDNELRAAAALALGKIGSQDALALLHKATEDRSEQVARAALLALNRIGKTTTNVP